MNEDAGSAKFPRIWAAIVFRAAVALLFCAPIYWLILAVTGAMKTDSASGPIILVLSVGAGIVAGLPSLLIAIGLIRQKRWSAWLAAACDTILAPMLAAMTISTIPGAAVKPAFGWLSTLLALFYEVFLFPSDHGRPPHDQLFMNLGTGLLAAAFLLEGIYLLRKMSVRRPVWLASGSVIIMLLAIGIIPGWIEARTYDPLLAYVNEHFVTFPKGSSAASDDSDLTIRTTDHRYITVHWIGNGPPWQFLGAPDPNNGTACIDVITDAEPHIGNAYEALKRIRSLGVNDPNLSPAGEATAQGDYRGFAFWSPKVQGTYVVAMNGGNVFLFLREDVVVK